MKKWKRIVNFCLLSSILVCGCGNETVSPTVDSVNNETQGEEDTKETASNLESTFLDSSEYFSNRDFEVTYDESESVFITLNGASASCDFDAVQIDGGTVTISDEGTYVLSGNLDDGMIVVDAEKTDKIQLVLDGASIHNETSAAIYVLKADKVFITTVLDTSNTLSNGGSFAAIDDNNIDAVIFSKQDLTLNGAGTLFVTAPAGHGIVSKDSLRVTSGSYDMNCASHGLVGKDEICIANADFTIVSGKDGIHAENSDDTSCGYVYIQSGTFDIDAQRDGISTDSYVFIEDGEFQITSGGGSENAEVRSSDSWGGFQGGGRHQGMNKGMKSTSFEKKQDVMNASGKKDNAKDSEINNKVEDKIDTEIESETEEEDSSSSMKGIKAGTDMLITGGTFTINSADDSVHSNASITIEEGNFDIASGDDAFHADDTLTIVDGEIQITESYEGLEALHVMIFGGDISLVAADDGINAAGGVDQSGMGGRDVMGGHGMQPSSSNGTILISGGDIYIEASGDGIDANGTLEITGGYIVVCGPTKGDTATLDFDLTGTITGGTFIGTGASAMAQTFSDSEQGVISVRVDNLSAGTTITLSDVDGNVLLTHTPNLSYAIVILSSSKIVSGETYILRFGSQSREVTAS